MDALVRVEGLDEFRRELRAIDSGWARELTRTHRELGQWLAPRAQGAASAMGGPQAHFAGKIKGRGTQAGARLEIAHEANAALWGAEKRTGWNQGHQGAPQHPKWVGSGWEPGGPGGPYGINDTLRSDGPEIVERFGDMVDDLASRAFPG